MLNKGFKGFMYMLNKGRKNDGLNGGVFGRLKQAWDRRRRAGEGTGGGGRAWRWRVHVLVRTNHHHLVRAGPLGVHRRQWTGELFDCSRRRVWVLHFGVAHLLERTPADTVANAVALWCSSPSSPVPP
jgi:hypothetical protein